MYIRSLKISNLKLIRDLTIDFSRGDKPRMWTVLVGRNGLCKTSILQAIALAASGSDRANQLSEVIAFPDRRTPGEHTRVTSTFNFGELHHKEREYPPFGKLRVTPVLHSDLVIPPNWQVFQGHSLYLNAQGINFKDFLDSLDGLKLARGLGLPFWFVAGYGVVRNLPFPKNSERSKDRVRERLETLFGKGRLIGTGFFDLFEDRKIALAFENVLKSIFTKNKDLAPGIVDLELHYKGGIKTANDLLESHRFEMQAGKGKVKVPATWLSHGYQATISWVADLIGQMFLEAGEPVALEDMEGLVLIDEIDLHLHPLWQAGLISALKAAFPRVQFVATTHSPMMLTGLEADEIIMLDEDDEGNIKVIEPHQSPDLMTGSEILDVFFGINKLYPVQTGEDLQRYGYLSTNAKRTDAEDAEMRKILVRLKAAGVEPGWDPKPRRKRK